MGIAIQGDGKKEKREMASPVGTEKASNKLIYDSSQLICLHTLTFLPGLLSSSPLLIVLRDGVWGQNKVYKPTNSNRLLPKSLGMASNASMVA